MDLRDTLRSTGAVRGFTDDPVADHVVASVLDDARFAPSGGNQQPWRVAVVKSPEIRQHMADLMRPVWNEYVGAQSVGKRAFAFGRSTSDAPIAAPNALLDQIQSIPVVLAVAADLTKIAIMDGNIEHRPPVVGGASIYPFCWSILLAAREHGVPFHVKDNIDYAGVRTSAGSKVLEDRKPALDATPVAKVRAALEALSRQQRRVIELAYYQGMSHTEIAAALD